MNREEIKHFKAMLRQGSLRHMNILLDDKFQKELLTIIKDYEKLQQENNQLKNELNDQMKLTNEENLQCSKYAIEINHLKEQRQELRSWLEKLGHCDIYTTEVLSKLNELEGKNDRKRDV